MSSNKQELEKRDETQPSKIPPFSSQSLSQPKRRTPRVCRNAASNLSKIPKRGVTNLSAPKKPLTSVKLTVMRHKPITVSQRATRSTISLRITKTTARPHDIPTSRSNMNTQQTSKSREATPRSPGSELQKAADRFAAKKNILAFKKIKEQLQSCQTDLMKKWEAAKGDLPPEESECKLIGLILNDCEGQLLTQHAQKIKVEQTQKTLEQFKKDMLAYVQNRSKICENLKANELLSEIEEVEKKRKHDKLIFQDILKEIDSCFESGHKPNKQPNTSNSELKAKVAKLLNEHNELRQNLEHNQKQFSRIIEEDKQLAEKDMNLAKKQAILDELKSTLESNIKQAEKLTNNELPEKLHSKTQEFEDLRKKYTAQQHKAQEQETKIKKLEVELKATAKDAEKRAQVEHLIGDQATRHVSEVEAVKAEVAASKLENEMLDREIQHIRLEIKKNKELDAEVTMFKERLKQADGDSLALSQSLMELENKLKLTDNQLCGVRNTNKELTRLQKSDAEKSQKIDALEEELKKSHLCFKNLLKKLDTDRKLPKVGNTIQTLESTPHPITDDSPFNYDIQLLKTRLLTKTAEFQNLFSTLSNKKLDIAQQENTIKTLLEINEEAQTLRLRQEAKIGHLEEEVSKLKQTLSVYQKNRLSSNLQRKEVTEADKDSATDSDSL